MNFFEIRYVVYLYSFYLYFDVKYTHKLRRLEKKTKLLSIITEFLNMQNYLLLGGDM